MNPIQWFHALLGQVSGSTLLERLFFASIEFVILAAAIWLLIAVTRLRTPRLIALLWALALVKPLVSLAIGGPFQVLQFDRPPASAPVATLAEPADMSERADPGPSGDTSSTAAPESKSPGEAAGRNDSDPVGAPVSMAPPAESIEPTPFDASSEAARIEESRLPIVAKWWMLGVALFGMWAVLSRIRLWRIISAAKPPSSEMAAVYAAVADQLDLKRPPPLLVTDALESPALAGLLRPAVLIPRWLAQRQCDAELTWSLRHELTHWKLADPLLSAVREVVETLFFFHPAVWWAGRKLETAVEIACDRTMVAGEKESADYAERLYQMLTHIRHRRGALATGGLFATRTQIGQRIAALLRTSPGSVATLSAWSLAGLLILSGVTLGFGFGFRGQVGDIQQASMAIRRVWAGPGVEFSGRIAPDGKRLTFIDWNSGNLMVRDLVDGENRNLTTEGTWEEPNRWAEGSVWSPDSKRIAYMWANDETWELRVIGLDGSDARTVYVAEGLKFVYPLAWSPRGDDVLVQLMAKDRTHRIAMVSLADGEVREIKSLGQDYPGWAGFSPDGRYILYDRRPSMDVRQRDLFLLSVDGKHETSLVAHPANDHGAQFSPDGRRIVFLSDRSGMEGVWTIPVDDGKPTGKPELLRRNVGRISPLGFARDGSYYYGVGAADVDVYIATMDPKTGKLRGNPAKLVQHFEGHNRAANWSPNGKRLVYLSRRVSPRTGMPSNVLVVHTLATGQEDQFSPELARYLAARFTPDGQSVRLFGVDFKGQRGRYLVDLKTGDLDAMPGEDDPSNPVWSPDGKQMFFVRKEEGGYVFTIVTRRVETGDETVLYRERSQGRSSLALSPDGRHLAFTTGWKAIRVISADGGEPRDVWRVSDNDSKVLRGGLVWIAGGKRLMFGKANAEGGMAQLWQVSADGGEPRRVGAKMWDLSDLRISPDGRRITFSARESDNGHEIWVLETSLFGEKK